MTSYLGHEIFPLTPNWADKVELSLTRDTQVFQALGLGAAWSNYDQTILGLKAGFLLASKAEIATLVDFFDARQGRWGAFWVPTWQADIVVTAAIGPEDTTITIEDQAYEDFWGQGEVTGRYLHFSFPDGFGLVRRVLDWPTATSLTLDAGLGVAVSEADLPGLLVSFLLLVRFGDDDLDLKYRTEAIAETTLTFRAVPGE